MAAGANYLWMSRPNDVYYSFQPLNGWITPTIGTGTHANHEHITQATLVSFEKSINSNDNGHLKIFADNSAGTFDTLPTTHINRGSQVTIKIGYGDALPSTGDSFFIKNWSLGHFGGRDVVVFDCQDAWWLLDRYKIPANQEWNFETNEKSAYDIIEKIILCIGGTLTDVSASAFSKAFYPKVEIKSGESASSLLKRILAFIPDVLRFTGTNASIIYPQSADTSVYRYYFPG